ncbi:MAG TPA: hypothetical protein VNI57_04410 [Candidatus Saccharimonadales bacterium]|nr:hypothetical protein [Candidatus Saccharimonadales bacterium]
MRDKVKGQRLAPAAIVVSAGLLLVASGCGGGGEGKPPEEPESSSPVVTEIAGVDTTVIRADVDARLGQFVATPIEADLSSLSESQRKVIDKLIDASRKMGDIFLRQAWAANPEIRQTLALSTDPKAAAALAYFDINAGPWDRIDGQPFIGKLPRPDGAGFYPADMKKEEFEGWIADHPDDAEKFKGLFTIVQRSSAGLEAVPYSQAYAPWLQEAATDLRAAAGLTDNASLKTYLEKRADAFLSDDYYDSDLAWMDLDSRIEITIGPYETYEDRMFGYKASFESFVTLQDPEASAKLASYKSQLPEMERNLPIPDEYKNLKRGTDSPIRVVDVVYTAGDTRAGVQTIAFNLPNDEKVREKKGSKKVLLRNVMDAKFRTILQPISQKVIAQDQLSHLSADAFFNETLFHELSHGLGPGKIKVNGRDTEVRLELKDHYSSLEEAKADVMGAWNILFMIDKGQFPASFKQDLFVTFLAGMFRGVRFGIEEAHGQGVALEYNYLKEKGAILNDEKTGRFSVDFDKFEGGLKDLVHDICVVQARGDYEGAGELLEKYAKVPPELQKALDGLKGIPVDIRPVYTAAGETE